MPIDPLRFVERQVEAGFYWLDIATQKTVWSDGIYQILNIAPGDVTPSRNAIREMIHPDDRRPVDEMDRMYSSGNPFKIEYRIIMHDRRVRWISNQGEFLMDAEGRPTSVFGVLRDVSSAHVAADMIEDYRRRFNTFLKLRTAIAWTADSNGQLTSVHDWKTAFACDEEPLGLKMLELVHEDDRERTRQDWGAAIANGHQYESEHRILDANRIYRWRRCCALPTRSPNGKIREWLGMTIDVNNEKTGGAIKGMDGLATGAQIRAARSILRLSVKDLSEVSGVPAGTIRRIEEIDGASKDDSEVGALLRAELEKRGTLFIFPAGLKPAVCPT